MQLRTSLGGLPAASATSPGPLTSGGEPRLSGKASA